MDNNQTEPTFEESVRQVLHTLPPPIRHYLGQGRYSVVSAALATKYRLTADQAKSLEREIMLLLMGINNPDEFIQALVEETKIEQQAVNNIATDVNTQIFIPLRSQVQGGGAQAASTAAPKPEAQQPQGPVQVPRYAPVPPPPPPAQRWVPSRPSEIPPPSVIIAANPMMPTRPQEYITKVPRYVPPQKPAVPAAVPGQFRQAAPAPTPTRPASQPQQPVPAAPPQMMDAAKALEEHEEVHLEFRQSRPSVSRITPPTPSVPPANLPGMISAPPPPRPAAYPPPVPSAPAPTPPATSRPPMGPYSADPYREPFDEK